MVVFWKNGLDYYECPRCGLTYVNPIRAAAEEVNRELYGDQRSKHLMDGGEHQRRHQKRARRLLRRFQSRGFKGRLLEIGCAEGLFLSVARADGWESHGLEIESQAAEYGRTRWGLDIFCGPIGDAPWREGSFDVVYMSNIMEHLLTPLEILKAVRRLLRHGGLLYLKTGNIKSYSYRALGPDWYYVDFYSKGHVAYYHPGSIVFALERAGFARRNIGVRTSGIHACKRSGPRRQRLWYSLLNPWAHLTKQGDSLRVEALRGND